MRAVFRFLAVACIFCSMIPLIYASPSAEAEQHQKPRLMCLNIGKADCMLLWAEDRVYLIDTGYEHTYAALENALRSFEIDHLDGVFLTHVHQDHEGGLAPLSESDVQVDAWYGAAIYYDAKPTKHPLYKAAANRGESVTWLESGDEIKISDDTYIRILGPLRTDTENENNNSLVMLFSSPDGSILFTGDMKEEEEQDLISAGLIPQADLLKVGHHGDNKATSQAFLNRVRPRAAVITTSTIEEPDTPARSTLSRLSAIGAETYVTQDALDGLLFTLEDGNVITQNFTFASIPERITGLQAAINVRSDTITVKNTTSSTITLAGVSLYSSKGNDVFLLPDITLDAHAEYVIGSEKSTVNCDYIAQKKRLWHDEDRDVGILYDAYGRILCGTDNGLSE